MDGGKEKRLSVNLTILTRTIHPPRTHTPQTLRIRTLYGLAVPGKRHGHGRRAWEKVIYLVQGLDTRTGFQLKSYITTRPWV